MRPQITIALQTDKPLAAYGSLAAKAESYGFDGVSVYNDMLYQPAWLPLLEIARQTERIKIGPAAVNPFTSHPINIAGNLALVDAASGSRAYCGFARGAWLDFIGLIPSNPIPTLREAILCVRHLLNQDKNPFAGEHFQLQGGDTLRWQNIRSDIPFLLGSWGPQTINACLPLVSEIKLGGTANPGAARQLKSFLKQQKADVAVVCGSVTVIDNDGNAARERARREVALYLPVVADLDKTITIESDRLKGIREAMKQYDVGKAISFISDELLAKFAFAGTPDEIIGQVLNLFEAGADRVEFGTPHGLSSDKGLALLGEIVLPNVHAALSR
ncbi:MAG: LLM class flavin-dependent oxidoreductase [Chloroflexi bacterium]|jgi:5,10-methylenetetrahydromethanopterin reductase|nr:LLM class flavin-dependent oxidoreductase [Chloroflexota bacterium]